MKFATIVLAILLVSASVLGQKATPKKTIEPCTFNDTLNFVGVKLGDNEATVARTMNLKVPIKRGDWPGGGTSAIVKVDTLFNEDELFLLTLQFNPVSGSMPGGISRMTNEFSSTYGFDLKHWKVDGEKYAYVRCGDQSISIWMDEQVLTFADEKIANERNIVVDRKSPFPKLNW